jgi:hypothetical protein
VTEEETSAGSVGFDALLAQCKEYMNTREMDMEKMFIASSHASANPSSSSSFSSSGSASSSWLAQRVRLNMLCELEETGNETAFWNRAKVRNSRIRTNTFGRQPRRHDIYIYIYILMT